MNSCEHVSLPYFALGTVGREVNGRKGFSFRRLTCNTRGNGEVDGESQEPTSGVTFPISFLPPHPTGVSEDPPLLMPASLAPFP